MDELKRLRDADPIRETPTDWPDRGNHLWGRVLHDIDDTAAVSVSVGRPKWRSLVVVGAMVSFGLLVVVSSFALNRREASEDPGPTAAASTPAQIAQPVPIEAARASDDELIVNFVGGHTGTGPCSTRYTATVDETETQVTIIVNLTGYVVPSAGPDGLPVGCTADGVSRSLSVSLSKPLGDRGVVDGVTSNPVPVFNARLRVPSSLPEGWTVVLDQGSGQHWTRVWSRVVRSPCWVSVTEGTQGPFPGEFDDYTPVADMAHTGDAAHEVLVDATGTRWAAAWQSGVTWLIVRGGCDTREFDLDAFGVVVASLN